ncbi:MAG: DUF4363 family protein [Oscillospiraceae bacterium]|nr:DUF4363 family protein [Oscillospiraceae bacterium]
MKAFYIPITLLTIILSCSVAASSYTRQCTADWIAKLEQCEDFLHEEQWERAQDRLLAAQKGWLQHATALHMILEHEDLEEAERLFSGAFAACREHDSTELRILLHQLITQLDFLAETQKANLKNIL